MPQHDPLPPRRPVPAGRSSIWLRFRRMMGWMALAAVAAVLLALIYLKSFGEPVSMHAQIATALGVGLTVLVGTALMLLVFLSSSSGYDDDATLGSGDDERDQGR